MFVVTFLYKLLILRLISASNLQGSLGSKRFTNIWVGKSSVADQMSPFFFSQSHEHKRCCQLGTFLSQWLLKLSKVTNLITFPGAWENVGADTRTLKALWPSLNLGPSAPLCKMNCKRTRRPHKTPILQWQIQYWTFLYRAGDEKTVLKSWGLFRKVRYFDCKIQSCRLEGDVWLAGNGVHKQQALCVNADSAVCTLMPQNIWSICCWLNDFF